MSKTILVIEDNKKHRDFLEDILSEEGYEVETAKDESEVQGKMSSNKPFDLITVDISIPEFEAIEFINKYKKEQRIIVVSKYAYDAKELLDEEWRIQKPFDYKVLVKRIKEKLALPKGR